MGVLRSSLYTAKRRWNFWWRFTFRKKPWWRFRKPPTPDVFLFCLWVSCLGTSNKTLKRKKNWCFLFAVWMLLLCRVYFFIWGDAWHLFHDYSIVKSRFQFLSPQRNVGPYSATSWIGIRPFLLEKKSQHYAKGRKIGSSGQSINYPFLSWRGLIFQSCVCVYCWLANLWTVDESSEMLILFLGGSGVCVGEG